MSPKQPIPGRRLEPLQLGGRGRLACLAVALACLAVLVLARTIAPNRSGTGTHHQLRMAPCQFLARTGLPCGTCGMTTSFSHFARGNVLASLYVQPFGAALALSTAMSLWAAGYCAVTGRPAYRLLRRLPIGLVMGTILTFWILGWGWKMWLVVSGHDGW